MRPHRPRRALGWIGAAILAGAAFAAARSSAESERIAELLGLRPGLTIADVGAGDGEWTEELARRVGPTGCVWATEIEPDDVEEIRERAEDAELSNVRAVVGSTDDAGLPEACCDAILLRLVYHHFTEPDAMRDSLWRALRPGGLVAVIEIEPQESWDRLPGVPERGGHGIEPADLVEEMTAAGFEVVARHDVWYGDDRYCVVFRRGARLVYDRRGA